MNLSGDERYRYRLHGLLLDGSKAISEPRARFECRSRLCVRLGKLFSGKQIPDQACTGVEDHADRRFVIGGAGEDAVGAGSGGGGDDAHDALLG